MGYYTHSSPDAALGANWKSGEGLFAGALFFVYSHEIGDASADAYRMSRAAKHTYCINENDVNLCKRNALDVECDDSWDGQRELCAAAVAAGFDGVIDEDEQGVVYMISIDKIGTDKLIVID